MWNVGYTTSKADKVKQGGFQRKPMTFCELTDFDNFEGFPKSNPKIKIFDIFPISLKVLYLGNSENDWPSTPNFSHIQPVIGLGVGWRGLQCGGHFISC